MRTRSTPCEVTDGGAMDGLEMSPASNTDGGALCTTPSGTGETGQVSMITADLQHLRLPKDYQQSGFELSSREAPTGSTLVAGSPATAQSLGRGVSAGETSLSEISEPQDKSSERLVDLTELGKLTDRHENLLAKGDGSSFVAAREIEAQVARTFAILGGWEPKSQAESLWEYGIGMQLVLMRMNTRKAQEGAHEQVRKRATGLDEGIRRSERLKRRGVSSGRVTKTPNK
jgi:hypothetical protein